jgi:hypothetical protein
MGVITRLQAQGVLVTAPANPLRGVSTESAARSLHRLRLYRRFA